MQLLNAFAADNVSVCDGGSGFLNGPEHMAGEPLVSMATHCLQTEANPPHSKNVK